MLPRVCPDGATSELLVARGQKGGSKKSIGAVISAEAMHPDGRPLHISLQAAASVERPGRWGVTALLNTNNSQRCSAAPVQSRIEPCA